MTKETKSGIPLFLTSTLLVEEQFLNINYIIFQRETRVCNLLFVVLLFTV